MGDFRASRDRFDEFVTINCPNCGKLNCFFREADTYQIKDKDKPANFIYKKKCDVCGIGIKIAYYDNITHDLKTYYKEIDNQQIKDGSYILDPNYKFSDPFFGERTSSGNVKKR